MSVGLKNSARVLITVAGLLILSACSGGDEPQSAPTIKDRAPSTHSESTSEVDGSGASSSESEEPVYENAQDVIVDENGRRSFPTQTAEQTLDMQWEFFVANIDGGEIPERPDVEIVLVDDEQQASTGYVSCMHDAGWPGVRLVDDGSIESGDIPAGQYTSYGIADYTCTAQNLLKTPSPMDESGIERLYDHQVDYVIPCLAEQGHQVANFPSKETFVDRYFAERRYTLATSMAGLSEAEEAALLTEDSSVECHAYPEGLWD